MNNFVIEQIDKFIESILPILIIVCFAIFGLDWKKRHKKKKTQLCIENRENAHGIIFGRQGKKVIYSPAGAEGSIIVMGGSGLGKTTSLLIPTLRSWGVQGNTCFVVDISGDICKNIPNMPRKLVYEPSNPQSIPYNIFGAIDQIEDEDDQNEALEQLAFLMMPDDEKMQDAARFYNTEGRKIITASLIALYHEGMDFIEICEKVVNNGWERLFMMIDATKNEKAISYINSFEGASEQNTAGCKQSADAVLKLFATNERVKKTIRRPKENEKCFMPSVLEDNNVFVVIEDSKLKLYAPLLHIITAQSLEFFSNRSNDSKTTILFCLDEFASFGKLEITDALRKLRKKHVRIMVLTQSMADIDLIYGRDERMAMMNNFRFKCLLGAEDAETQEYYAKIIGYKKTKKRSKSTNGRQTTHTESEAKEWAIEPDALARLGDSLILLHPDGWLKLRKNFYYEK